MNFTPRRCFRLDERIVLQLRDLFNSVTWGVRVAKNGIRGAPTDLLTVWREVLKPSMAEDPGNYSVQRRAVRSEP